MTALGVALVAILAVVAIVVFRKALPKQTEPDRFPFVQVRPLSKREQVLYWRLRKVLPDQMVLAQVALSRILEVEKGQGRRAWNNRINRMTVDFLVCLPDATIVAAVELDDASHQGEDRIRADVKKDMAMASAGIKLLRFNDLPSEDELQKLFHG